MQELKNLLEQLKNLDNERDRLTYTRKTHDVAELFSTLGEFVDDQLTEAIDAVNAAIDKIEEQAQLIEKIHGIVVKTPGTMATIEQLGDSLGEIAQLLEESEC